MRHEPKDYVVTIDTTTLNKRVSFLASKVEWIAETETGTTVHLSSGRHLTTNLDFDKMYALIWIKA